MEKKLFTEEEQLEALRKNIHTHKYIINPPLRNKE